LRWLNLGRAGSTASEAPASTVGKGGANSQTVGLVVAAAINSLGNITSRILGLVREGLIASIFGASGSTSAFDATSIVPKMVYELLIGGLLSAALVPVLSDYASEEHRAQMEHVLSILLSLAAVVLIAVVAALELGAHWVAPLLLGGFDSQLLSVATKLVRIIVPSILIYGFSGILQAYHYACKRFVYPAAGAPAHNLGMIIAVILLAPRLDIASLSVGVLVAASAQLLVQLPGLRGLHLSLNFDWHHPAVRRILRLYAPVVLSIVIANLGIVIDRNLASRTAEEAITWMNKATFLIQLPLGLVSMAISLAILPTLCQIDARKELDKFKRTFTRGMRLVLVVIIPATAGLFALGEPIIRLIFEHGEFAPVDTAQTWRALRCYLPGLPFAAIDLPLVFAFYAQKDTITPVLVGILGVLVYLAVGPALAFVAGWGFVGLVVANSVQLTGHALLMLFFFSHRFQGLHGYGMVRTTLKAAVASLLVAALSRGSYAVLAKMNLLAGTANQILSVGLAAGLGAVGYLLGARVLRIEELQMLWVAVRRRRGLTHEA